MVPENYYYHGADMLGREITLSKFPSRIVSLVPSQTELLCYLGFKSNLVGITKFCTHPSGLKNEIRIIGGTKTVDVQKVLDLKPDIIIANKEENLEETVHILQNSVPVWVSDVRTLQQAFQMISLLSQMLNVTEKGNELVQLIDNSLSSITKPEKPLKAAYFIWHKPWMLAGKDTFIDSMMALAGLENIVDADMGRYPELSAADIIKLQPWVLLFSSEPYPFSEDKLNEYLEFSDFNKIVVDGRLFSWYGSSMMDFSIYVSNHLLNKINL